MFVQTLEAKVIAEKATREKRLADARERARREAQALVVANALASTPSRPRDLRILAPDAAKIVQGNVYGWFERIERGLYGLTSSGRVALVTWANHVSAAASA